MSIEYVRGDVTSPLGSGPRIIAHICNDVGAYDAGVAAAIRNRWPEAKARYRDWFEGRIAGAETVGLGMVQLVRVESDLWVANMIGQRGLRRAGRVAPIRYGAVSQCLGKLASLAKNRGAVVHMPRIGTGLAGGTWDRIEPIITDRLVAEGVAVVVYDL